MYDNIIIPVDFDCESNRKSVKKSLPIIENFDSNVYILYVKTDADNRLQEDDEMIPISDMKKFFRENNKDIDVEYAVTEGKPIEKICKFVDKKDGDLIAMATHSRSWLERLALGSLTEQTIQKVQCPVLTMTDD